MSPIISSGDIRTVKDLDQVSPTECDHWTKAVFCVLRGGAVGVVPSIKEANAQATIATCAVPPAELAMVSTRSARANSFLSTDRLRLFL